MNTLPLELHSQIFEYACIDGGYTARSLARVSHYVREVAKPYTYQSVSTSGLNSTTELLNRLTQIPVHMRRVRHLFLSDWTQEEAKSHSVPNTDADMDRYDVEKATIIALLDLVAPTLQSLTFVANCPFNSTYLIGHLFSLKFPYLLDLAVHGFYPFSASVAQSMPRLERLHLSGNRNPYGLFQSGVLDAACPNIKELEVSGLVAAPSFAQEVEDTLLPTISTPENPIPTSRLPRITPTLPRHLARLTVRLGPTPSARRRSVSMQHGKMKERLLGLAQCAEALDGVEYKLSEVTDIEHECVYDRMMDEWRGRLEGAA